MPRPSRISSPARCRRPSGRGSLLDAHDEGWAAVGTAVVPTGRDRELEPWRGGGGRNPRFDQPLLLPSLLAGIEPTTHLGLPAYDGDDGLFDGRVAVTLPRRSGRRPTLNTSAPSTSATIVSTTR